MTLRGQIKDLTAQLAKANADLAVCVAASEGLRARNTAYTGQIAALGQQITALKARIVELELEVAVHGFENVPAGANLQDVLREAGPGAKLQLPASLKVGGVATYAGQHLRGPCTIIPTNLADPANYGINGKTNEAFDAVYEDIDVTGFGLRGLVPWAGSTVLGGHYNKNGEMGIGTDMEGANIDGVTMKGVTTNENGSAGLVGHGASGYKFFHTKGPIVVIDHTALNNVGNGGWCDAECGYWQVKGGEYGGNQQKNLFFEKCGGNHGAGYVNPSGTPYKGGGVPYDGMFEVDGAYVHDGNKARDNGNGGVYIVASKNFVIKNLKSRNNKFAIVVRNDPDRVADDHPGWVVSNGEIVDSTNDYGTDTVVIGNDVGSGVRRT